jgi:hypothetical protein
MEIFDENTEVLLRINDRDVVMPIALAMRVAGDINSSPKIASFWSDRQSMQYIGDPEPVAQILPITVSMRLTLESNKRRKEKEGR